MTWEHVFLTFLALWTLYLVSVTIDRVRKLSAQVAVLTIRLTETAETLDALDVVLRTAREESG